jgi:uncharacterized protein (DUF2141 family)
VLFHRGNIYSKPVIKGELTVKKVILVIAGILLISRFCSAQLKLDVEIAGIRNNEGRIMLQVLDEKQNVISQQMGSIKDKSCFFSFPCLKPGRYAVRFYHDENLNQIMEKNMLGKPTEGYGFSNNVTATFSMPPFEKWLFDLNEDQKLILKVVY